MQEGPSDETEISHRAILPWLGSDGRMGLASPERPPTGGRRTGVCSNHQDRGGHGPLGDGSSSNENTPATVSWFLGRWVKKLESYGLHSIET